MRSLLVLVAVGFIGGCGGSDYCSRVEAVNERCGSPSAAGSVEACQETVDARCEGTDLDALDVMATCLEETDDCSDIVAVGCFLSASNEIGFSAGCLDAMGRL